jgi:DNA-directed RNA polymerase beta subunit
MSEKFKIFEIIAEQDELGDSEEFSWDLSPIVNPENTSHLDENGLPKIGTTVSPGMILVGKIGKSKSYATDRKPTDLEIHGLDFIEFKNQFGHLWCDGSVYVPEGVFGEVESAEIKSSSDGKLTATVKLRLRPVETTNASDG